MPLKIICKFLHRYRERLRKKKRVLGHGIVHISVELNCVNSSFAPFRA